MSIGRGHQSEEPNDFRRIVTFSDCISKVSSLAGGKCDGVDVEDILME